MLKASQFSYPCQFTGTYPTSWAGYTFLQKTEQDAYHPGIDWNWGAGEQDSGMPVQAIANGVCVHTSEQATIGYGEIVVLKHELTDEMYEFIKLKYKIDARIIYSFYAHLKDSNVKLNQEVERGDLVGWIGKSGTIISHLHQELYKSVPGTTWRYWPKLSSGWTVDKLKQYYIDTFDLIKNQPSVTLPTDMGSEMTKIREERDRNWNWFTAVCIALGVETNVDVAVAEAKKSKELSQTLIDKEKQLLEVQTQATDLQAQLDLKTQAITEVSTQVATLTIAVGEAQKKIEILTNQTKDDQVALEDLKLAAQITKNLTGWRRWVFNTFIR